LRTVLPSQVSAGLHFNFYLFLFFRRGVTLASSRARRSQKDFPRPFIAVFGRSQHDMLGHIMSSVPLVAAWPAVLMAEGYTVVSPK
jgi:hypothetical protein